MASRAWKMANNVPRWLRDDLLATPVTTMLRRVRHRLKAAVRQATGAATAEPTVRDMVDFPSRPARWEHFAERHYQAFRRYTPARYAGRVSLLTARTQPLTWLNDAEREWRYLSRAVDVYPVSGTHYSIVREPNVQQLAAAIEEAVSRARAQSAR
jgi:thioesterase domain-containing protein